MNFKTILIAALALVIVGTGGFLYHRVGVLTHQRNDAIEKVVLMEQAVEGYKRSLAELQAVHAETLARKTSTVTIRKAIADAPKTSSCVDSPSIRAALDGLRNRNSPETGNPR